MWPWGPYPDPQYKPTANHQKQSPAARAKQSQGYHGNPTNLQQKDVSSG